MNKRMLTKPVRGPFQRERGGLLQPLGASLVLPTFALGEHFSYRQFGLKNFVRHSSLLTWRGLATAPFFRVISKINYIGRFPIVAHVSSAGFRNFPIRPVAALFRNVLHQISNNLFKAFHFVVLPSFTSKSSSGEKQWDYKNQTMRLSK